MHVLDGNSDGEKSPANEGMHLPRHVPSGRTKVLLLQGPIGPFFRDLAHALTDAGFDVLHTVFNAADLSGASFQHSKVFKGERQAWRDWLSQLIRQEGIAAVIFFGCERFQHRIASELCAELALPVLALEEGYLRPGYVAAEWGGNNRFSPVTRITEQEIRSAKPPKNRKVPGWDNYNRIIQLGCQHYIIRALGAVYFGRHLYHKKRPVISEALLWIRNMARKFLHHRSNEKIIREMMAGYRKAFYLIPLQVSDDMQLLMAGRGWNNDTLIEKAIGSFAAEAPMETRLVFKVHPMERGHSDALSKVHEIAQMHGVDNRVFAIDEGPLAELVKASRGMLTINSTSGLSALHHRVPLGVLGEAIFARPDLAYCIDDDAALASFWTEAQQCDEEMAKGFRNCLIENALLPGDYYVAAARRETADRVAEKLREKI